MNNEIKALFDESIKMELNVAEIYMLFSKIFSEDKDLWCNLYLEEKNHAALLRSGIEYFMPAGAFPLKILYPKAFLLAIKLEKSSGELHFQQIMKESTDLKTLKVFQQLNNEDRSHVQRIRAFMKEKGIDKDQQN